MNGLFVCLETPTENTESIDGVGVGVGVGFGFGFGVALSQAPPLTVLPWRSANNCTQRILTITKNTIQRITPQIS